MRQIGDTEYSEILNHVRLCSQTKSDISVLRSRLTSCISDPINVSPPPFVNALCLLPLKEQVEEYNDKHSIVETTTLIPGVVSHEEVPESLISSNDRDCAGLSRKEGLVNGARGIIVGFSWPNGASDQAKKGNLPQKVHVKFHESCVGLVSRVTINDSSEQEAVPIEPVTAKFYGKQEVTLQHTQLPLLPCWAATIYKVQGLSLDAAVIDLGPKMFEDGMVYVALSRVRTLQGVALLGLV
ncbi:PREDICTED: ATP-dependent DNA helicase PIF6-like [Amphimedon queenslandica]|uniref:ATP-dependent DNA helicase n=1 Tax=Amphimedon queenslandica TaxID=400682 RepID=A0A1X7VJQ0_AMPQE|nr:PREDICTED: ATP-dependent DNA helicase PIF6-like [Amphimedon queenslandica]|eukprot:XP_011410068.1 PREDICTED: ATP-dependent DNA helicase PIF6-like [Amphimedon queenslandica]